jgi:cardiolipin synthase
MTWSWYSLPPHVELALTILWVVYLAVLAGWIALQKREPIATLSWLLSLALLPVVGLLVYHFFGPQRIRRQRLKRLRSRARLDHAGVGDSRADDSALMRLAQACSSYPPSSASRVQLLVDGHATFESLLEAIAGARRHVHLEYYIFESDRTGTRLRDALIERAAAGVQIRLLLDAVGSAYTYESFLGPLRAAGAQIAFFHRFRMRRLWRPKLNLRSHRKIVVVDGRVGFTGGINITDEQDERLHADAYRDLHLRMEGEAVRWLQLAFVEDWVYSNSKASKAPDTADFWPDAAPGSIRAHVLPAGPDSPWETIHRTMIAAINGAADSVWLSTPYFVPGEAARMALTSAALRGVDVRLLVPARSDSLLVSIAARSYFDELQAAGVRVFEYPRMLHTKALLVDQRIAILGSSNFDNRSFRLNFELCVLFDDAGVAADLQRILAGDLQRAAEVAIPRPLGLPARLCEAVARQLSPLL